jgi:hypothetical protein
VSILVGVDRSESPDGLVHIWQGEVGRKMNRLSRLVNEWWFGTTKVRDENDRVIADCTTVEAADAARRLLIPR